MLSGPVNTYDESFFKNSNVNLNALTAFEKVPSEMPEWEQNVPLHSWAQHSF